MMSRTTRLFSLIAIGAILWGGTGVLHAAPVPTASLPELQNIQRKLTGLRCKDSDSRWSQKRILQLIPTILNGEDIDYSGPDMKGNTCLHYACELGSRQLIHWLVENGADVNRVETGGGNTPLHNAARLASLNTVNYLLEHGANPNVRNNEGKLPADVVGKDDHDAIVAQLNGGQKSSDSNLSGGASVSEGLDVSKAPQIVFANDHLSVTVNNIWQGYGQAQHIYTFYNNSTLKQIADISLSMRTLEHVSSSPDGKWIAGLCLPSERYSVEPIGLMIMDSDSGEYEIVTLTKNRADGNEAALRPTSMAWKGAGKIEVDHTDMRASDTEGPLVYNGNIKFQKKSFSPIKVEIKRCKSIDDNSDEHEKALIYSIEYAKLVGLDYTPNDYWKKLITQNYYYLFNKSHDELTCPLYHDIMFPDRFCRATAFGTIHEVNMLDLKEYTTSLASQKIVGLCMVMDGSVAAFHYNEDRDTYKSKNGFSVLDRAFDGIDYISNNHSIKKSSYTIIRNGEKIISNEISNSSINTKSGVIYSCSGGIDEAPGRKPTSKKIELTYAYLLEPTKVYKVTLPEVSKRMDCHGAIHADFQRKLVLVDDKRYVNFDSDDALINNWEKQHYQFAEYNELFSFMSSGISLVSGALVPKWSGWVPARIMGDVDCELAAAPEEWRIFASGQHRGDVTLGIVSPANKGRVWNIHTRPQDVFVAWPRQDKNRVLILGAGGSQAFLKEYNLQTGKERVIKEWYSDDKRLFCWDNTRRWFSIPQGAGTLVLHISDNGDIEEVFRLHFFENGNKYAILLPDGRYSGSPGVEKYLQYTANGKTAPMSIMAPWLKKPADIIRLFGGDEEQAAALEATRNRWLKKQNIAPDAPMPDLSAMPTVTVPKYPELNAKADDIEVPIRVQAAKSAVTHVEVKVNEVAATGAEADLDSPIPAGSSGDLTAKVKLTDGLNWITVQAVTESGVKGNIERFRVIKRQPSPSRLYVVALGVSDYDAEEVPDLRFAAKDAGDVAAAVGKLEADSKVLLLRDKEVRSQDALKQIREFLSTATLNDRVIVYCAGHGVLDDGEYYYAPADYNPESTKETGVSLDELKATLADTPARRRLLLLDTCNAGAIGEEAEEKLALNAGNLPTGVRAIQHRGMKVKSSAMPLNSTQKRRYIEELFVTEDASTGVNVIGGSAAAEYAMESEEWNNGVFTASLLEALSPEKKLSTLPEISDYIRQRVRELTNGEQSPSVRLLESGEVFPVKATQALTSAAESTDTPEATHAVSDSSASVTSASVPSAAMPSASAPAGSVNELLEAGYAYKTKKQYAQAFDCYYQAAQMGDSTAWNNLGRMYREGQTAGCPMLFGSAAQCRYECYRRSATAPNPCKEGLLNYARCLRDGIGCAPDISEARKYYQMAIDKGSDDAAKELRALGSTQTGPVSSSSASAASASVPASSQNSRFREVIAQRNRIAGLTLSAKLEKAYQKRVLELLDMIADGAPIDTQLDAARNNTTCLHNAAAICDLELVQWLVEHGADINARAKNGARPLDCVGEDKSEGSRVRKWIKAQGGKSGL